MPIVPALIRCAPNLVSVNVSATSLGILNAGVRERPCVVEEMAAKKRTMKILQVEEMELRK